MKTFFLLVPKFCLEMPSSTLCVEHKIFFGANYSKAVGFAIALPTLRDH
ncbi:MAG: hypothetical protein KAI83_08650 [Thiomargarita sp.]|nr:hypothetical protein [Thiomargarita sp.]